MRDMGSVLEEISGRWLYLLDSPWIALVESGELLLMWREEPLCGNAWKMPAAMIVGEWIFVSLLFSQFFVFKLADH